MSAAVATAEISIPSGCLADMGTSRGDLFVVETGEFTAVKVNRREIRDHAHCFTVSATAAPTAMIQTPVSGTTVCANV